MPKYYSQADAKFMARSLSLKQWEYLGDHVDGSRPIVRDAGEESTRKSLMSRNLIRERKGCHDTVLTEFGTSVLHHLLGYWADTLNRASANNFEKRAARYLRRENFDYGDFATPEDRPTDGGHDLREEDRPV